METWRCSCFKQRATCRWGLTSSLREPIGLDLNHPIELSAALKSGVTRKQSAAWPEHGSGCAFLFAAVRHAGGVLRPGDLGGCTPAQRLSVGVAPLDERFAAINSVPGTVHAALAWLCGKPRHEALDLIEP